MKTKFWKLGAVGLMAAVPLSPLLAQSSGATATTTTKITTAVPVGSIDSQADALLKDVESRMKAVSHLSAVLLDDDTSPVTEKRKKETVRRWETTLTLAKPGYAITKAREGMRSKTDPTRFDLHPAAEVTTGIKETWASMPSIHQYVSMERGKYLEGEYAARPEWALRPLDGFFNPTQSLWSAVQTLKKDGRLRTLSPVRNETWEGAAYSVVDVVYTSLADSALDEEKKTGVRPVVRCSVYIGTDSLVHRTKTLQPWGEVREYALMNLKINSEKVDPAKFVFHKPAGATLRPEAPKMLTVGTVAPEFTALSRDNKPVRLSDFKGQVVVLDFMASWCGPCIASMPHLKAIQDAVKGQPVTILSVGVWDKRDAFNVWLDTNEPKYPFTYAFDPSPQKAKGNIAADLYQVPGIPGTYVIGKDGKIVASIVGYSRGDTRVEDGLRKAGITVNLPAEHDGAAEKPATVE